MKPSDQIIIEELKRIVLMQAQEITRLMARIDVPEHEPARYTTRKYSNNSSMPPSKDENRPPCTSSLREKETRFFYPNGAGVNKEPERSGARLW